jgi:hypothetical protein
MPRTFIAHDQLRKGRDNGGMVQAMDTRSAERWGPRIVVFQDADAFLTPEAQWDLANEKLADFTVDDYLVCVGAPDVISLLTVAAAQKVGMTKLNLLVWNKYENRYTEKTLIFGGTNGREHGKTTD